MSYPTPPPAQTLQEDPKRPLDPDLTQMDCAVHSFDALDTACRPTGVVPRELTVKIQIPGSLSFLLHWAYIDLRCALLSCPDLSLPSVLSLL